MKLLVIIVSSLFLSAVARGQEDGLEQSQPTMLLEELLREALEKNADIQAAQHREDVAAARARQSGTLEDPQLGYAREQMPGFRFSEARMQKIEIAQAIRFPSKLSTESKVAAIALDRSRKSYDERVDEVLTNVRDAYYRLWFVQQSIQLDRENINLLKQFSKIAETKYSVGAASQQDVLKSYVELAKIENRIIDARQRELGAKAEVAALLDRSANDTVGAAQLSAEVAFPFSLDSLERIAVRRRPALLEDSLMVMQREMQHSLAQQGYLPDLRFGLTYVTFAPTTDFHGWSVSAGISLPFAPWTIGKAAGRVEEAEAAIQEAKANYRASRNEILSALRNEFFRVRALVQQSESYRAVIIPQARQSLEASVSAYQTGRTDFLQLIDAYRTLADLMTEQLKTRTEFERSAAELERIAGIVTLPIATKSEEQQ